MNTTVTVLAISRLTSLLVEDEITRPLRERLADWGSEAQEFDFAERLVTLSTCPRCSSIWSAAAVLVANRVRWLRPLVWVLAGSEAALLVHGIQDRMTR
jgi:hypothetical protein